MPLLAYTMSYRDTAFEDLEQVAIRTDELEEALPCLLRAPDVGEALVLSTCNRVEVYTWVKDPEAGADQIRLFLEDLRGLPIGWTRSRGRVLLGDDVIRHLFSVAAGLDSMVTGESEIQGQVRSAYKIASSFSAVGPHLHGLFRWALESGKHTRSATGLARATDSFPRAAVKAIDAKLGGVDGRDVLVVGNGQMAIASLRALASAGAKVRVAARRPEAAKELADRFDGDTLPMEELEQGLIAADAAVFATSTPVALIGVEAFRRLLLERAGRPITVVDLGLPRNVHPDTVELDGGKDGFDLFDLAKLDDEGYTVHGGRRAQLDAAGEIVLIEAERCVAWFRSKPADTVVAAIQAQAKALAEREAAQAAKIPGLDERQRAAVEQAIRRTVSKLVHTPTIRTKEASVRGDEHLLQAAQWLFGIDSGNGQGGGHDEAAERSAGAKEGAR
jgi:glutamyl-tRNA reductase